MTLNSGKVYIFTRKTDMKIVFMKLDLKQFAGGFRWVNYIDEGFCWEYVTINKFNKLGLSFVGEV